MRHSFLNSNPQLPASWSDFFHYFSSRVTSNVFYPGKLPSKKGEIMITLYKGISLKSDLGPKSGWRNQFNKFQPTFVVIR